MNIKPKLAIVGAAGLLVGAAAGFLVANKKSEAKWQKISEEEIESVKDTYNLLKGNGKYADPEAAAAAFRERAGYFERLDELQYLADGGKPEDFAGDSDPREPEEDSPVGEATISSADPDTWGQVTPKVNYNRPFDAIRESSDNIVANVVTISEGAEEPGDLHIPVGDEINKTVPYVISELEYFQEEQDYEKLTITYYKKDNSYVDERDQPINNVEETVGDRPHRYFGRKEDPNVVYVRNHKNLADFEILFDEGSYIEEVLGMVYTPTERNE